MGIGIGVAVAVAVVAGVGFANRATRLGDWGFGDRHWWGSDRLVTRP